MNLAKSLYRGRTVQRMKAASRGTSTVKNANRRLNVRTRIDRGYRSPRSTEWKVTWLFEEAARRKSRRRKGKREKGGEKEQEYTFQGNFSCLTIWQRLRQIESHVEALSGLTQKKQRNGGEREERGDE